MDVLRFQCGVIFQYLCGGHARSQQIENKVYRIALVAYGLLTMAYLGIKRYSVRQVIHPMAVRETYKPKQSGILPSYSTRPTT
jgi:hypothetical protein